MRMIRALAASTVAVAILAAAEAQAQNPHRQGIWSELGAGPSSVRIGCVGCDDISNAQGAGAFLRLGGTISPNVLMGVELYGVTAESSGYDGGETPILADFRSFGPIVIWYPGALHAFVKSGIVAADGRFTVTPTEGEPVVATGLGVGLTFGFGFDAPITKQISLTTNASVFFTAIGDMVLAGRTVEDVIPTSYVMTVGLTVR
jgi:hypothetical protein